MAEALARTPVPGARVSDDALVLGSDDAARHAGVALTTHIKAILAENRAANTYRGCRLRIVRTAIYEAVPAARPTKTPKSVSARRKSPDVADRVARLAGAKEESKALREWKAAGEKGKRPATPNLDALDAARKAS